jgi:outer membrane immunogenic protein
MRRSLLSLLCTASLSVLAISAAPAADIVTRRPAPAVVPAPAFNWTGFYIGLNAGWGWAERDVAIAGIGSFSGQADGFVGGGQAGYNWQYNNVVFGIETDIQWADLRRDHDNGFLFGLTPFGMNARHTTEWFGTLRGRLGLTWNSWLGYITGGWAYGGRNDEFVLTNGALVFAGSNGRSRSDGWTIGGGVESMFAPNWTAKLEYLFVRFPGESVTLATNVGPITVSASDVDAHVFRFGINYLFR